MPRVLVVDDESAIRLLARVVLTAAGHDVDDAESAEAAIERLAAEPRPDLVVLDMRLPGIGGWEVFRAIRHDPALAGVAVVVVTADVDARDRAPDDLRDYDHFLTKPFKGAELVGAVEHALRR